MVAMQACDTKCLPVIVRPYFDSKATNERWNAKKTLASFFSRYRVWEKKSVKKIHKRSFERNWTKQMCCMLGIYIILYTFRFGKICFVFHFCRCHLAEQQNEQRAHNISWLRDCYLFDMWWCELAFYFILFFFSFYFTLAKCMIVHSSHDTCNPWLFVHFLSHIYFPLLISTSFAITNAWMFYIATVAAFTIFNFQIHTPTERDSVHRLSEWLLKNSYNKNDAMQNI